MENKKKETFVINGFSGQKKLEGSISVNGAKNAILQALAFSFLFKDEVIYKNVPEISDIQNMLTLLREVGAVVNRKSRRVYSVKIGKKISTVLSPEISKKFRASIVLTGPILARYGEVSFPHPGGCVIGSRPIDIFLDGFSKFGAKTEESEFGYKILTTHRKLRGAKIFLKKPSVTGAQTLMMAAVLARGKTVIKNVPLEPETKILADYLNSCGAKIFGAGTPTIEIVGTGLLEAKGKVFETSPDRIEAGSFLIMGALCAKNLEITNCWPGELEALVETLLSCGVKLKVFKNKIVVWNESRQKDFTTTEIKTHEYPGFPSDLQPPMSVFLTQANGESLVFETIFEGRLNYITELARMGADIKLWDPHRVTIKGPTALRGREVESPDIRAGLAFIIAAIVADGQSVIHNIHCVDRGYEKIEGRLKKIGVDIVRIKE